MQSFSRYLPINDTLFAGPVYLTGAGRAVLAPGSPYPPGGHPDLYQFKWREGRVLPEFSLVWIESGSGVWQTSEGIFPINAGQVGRVLPGQWHRYRPGPEGWTECWIQYNGRLIHELENEPFFSGREPVHTPRHPRRFARQLLDFLKDLASPDFINSTFQGLRLAGLFGLVEKGGMPPVNPASGLVEQARRHIWSHSHRQLNVEEVAVQLGVGRRTLERAFRAAGFSGVLEEITRCRLNRAERLLCETKLPVQHIVNLSGFGTPEQMRVQFRKHHGKSPSRFRTANQARNPG